MINTFHHIMQVLISFLCVLVFYLPAEVSIIIINFVRSSTVYSSLIHYIPGGQAPNVSEFTAIKIYHSCHKGQAGTVQTSTESMHDTFHVFTISCNTTQFDKVVLRTPFLYHCHHCHYESLKLKIFCETISYYVLKRGDGGLTDFIPLFIFFKHPSNTLQHPSNTLKTPFNALQNHLFFLLKKWTEK